FVFSGADGHLVHTLDPGSPYSGQGKFGFRVGSYDTLVVVTAPELTVNGVGNAGACFIFDGPSGSPISQDRSSAPYFAGEQPFSRLGTELAVQAPIFLDSESGYFRK